MIVISSFNIKGGVGKTATAVNLAYLCAEGGARTLLWDLDPQGAASFYFRVGLKARRRTAKAIAGRKRLSSLVVETDHEDLDLIPAGKVLRRLDIVLARARADNLPDTPSSREANASTKHRAGSDGLLAKALATVADRYDYVFLDCPPGLSLAAEAIFTASDALIVPTIPTVLSLRTLEQLTTFLSERAADGEPIPRVLPFFSMVDRRKKLHREVVEAGFSRHTREGLTEPIPYSSEIERTGVYRTPIAVAKPRHPAARAYRNLWFEVAERLRSRASGDGPGRHRPEVRG